MYFPVSLPSPFALEDDEPYDDFTDHDMCADCKGAGKYTGWSVVETCGVCDGAGWVPKGQGWTKADHLKDQAHKAALARRGFGP